MNFKSFSYLLLVLIVGCSSFDYESYEGKQLEIDYLHKEGFVKGDWIEIDGIKFTHLENMDDVTDEKDVIPTSDVIKDSLGPNKKFRAEYNSLSIAIMLGNKLEKILRTEWDSSSRVLITNLPLLMTQGKLRIVKSDSTRLTVNTSSGYPAEVKVIED